MITFLSKYKFLLYIAAALSGVYLMHVYDNNTLLELKHKYEVQVIAQQQKIAKLTKQTQEIANTAQEEYNANQKKNDEKLAYYRRLISERGGLYDNGNSTSSSSSTGGASSNQGTASGNRLSEEATGFLLDQANKADRVVDQYLVCQKYVETLTEYLLKETK